MIRKINIDELIYYKTGNTVYVSHLEAKKYKGNILKGVCL